jgi:HK97 family phage major capsid protein
MTTKDLREKRVRLAEEANSILKKAHDDNRDVLRAEEEESWTRIHAEIDALERHITMVERQEKVAAQLSEAQERVVEPSVPRSERATVQTAMLRYQAGQEESLRAFRTWLLASPTSGYSITSDDRALCDRVGINLMAKQLEIRLSTAPMRDLTERKSWEYRAQGVVAPGTAGGYTVPDELMRSIEIALLTYGGMRQAATIIRTASGASLPIPTVNDTTQTGVILDENTQVANQDVVFAQLTLDAYKYSSKQVLVSVELLQDSSVNIGAMLGELLGTRIGRITNTHFTVGTGTAQPRGIVPAAAVGFTTPATDAQVTAWKYGSIVELEHSVDPAYRRGASWMMADSSLKKTKQIVDTTGRVLWAASISQGAPDTLMGYPIVINQDVAAMAANAKSVVFGDLSKYLIRDVLGVTLLRLEERYADFHQVAFLAFARMDGDLLNAGTNPVKVLVNAAT